MGLSGQNANGGFDYTIGFGSTTKRAKRDGRNPSTGAFAPNQSTGAVADNITVETGLGKVKVSVNSYKALSETEEEQSN